MSRSLALVLAAFAVIALAGVWLLTPSTRHAGPAAELGAALPGLAGRVNDVERLTLSDMEQSLTLVRQAERWQFEALPGFPLKQGKVRELLLTLADIQLMEAKTDDPAFHDAIGLGADATTVRFGDDSGLMFGKQVAGVGQFVRRIGEDQCYVAKDARVPQITTKAWADVTLPVARKELVTRVDVKDGQSPYSVTVTADGQVLEGLKDGEALAYDGVLDTVVAGAVYIDFNDVKPAGDIDWSSAAQTVFSGAQESDRLVYDIAEDDDAIWLRAAPSGAFMPDAEVDWTAWAFAINDYRMGTLLKPRSALIQAPDEAAP